MKRFVITAMVAAGFSVSCAKKQQAPSVKAQPKVEDSFSVNSSSLQVTSKNTLTISRSALEKEFLLQGELIPQTIASMGHALKSRIVAFREKNGRLYMLEASQGHTVTTDLPTNILLAEFRVLNETADLIEFDFNTGMTKLFVMGDLYGTDMAGLNYNPGMQFETARIASSYLDSVTIKNNRLVIRQIAQQMDSESIEPIEIRYYIEPYQASPEFEPMVARIDLDRYGFFETAPQLLSNSTSRTYVARWNPKRPIVWAISSNTPKEVKDAVRDGLLYWNKQLGREVVQVIDAPQGVTAPDADYNLVQWVPYDDAGFAFADIQTDPRNGEIKHAQVFITSVFAVNSKSRARALVRKLRASEGKTATPSRFVVAGFESESLCNLDVTHDMVQGLEKMLAESVDEESFKKASLDYVRMVVSHEIGHTMSLRHNFAGNAIANYNMEDKDKLLAEYFSAKKTPAGLIATSSVMDYQSFEDRLYTGDAVANNPEVFVYDKMAMDTLYNGKTFADNQWPLFCTDRSMGKFMDCQIFDSGASVIEFRSQEEKDALAYLPNTLVEQYINSQTALGEEYRIPVQRMALSDPEKMATAILGWRTDLLKLFTKEGRLLRIAREFPVAAGFNADVIFGKQNAYLLTEFDRLGGLSKVLPPLAADFVPKAEAKVASLLSQYENGLGLGDRKFAFSSDDLATMKQNISIFLTRFERAYRMTELKVLSGSNMKDIKIKMSANTDKLVEYLQARARDAILKTGTDFIAADLDIPKKPLMPLGEDTKVLMVEPTEKIKKQVFLPVFSESVDIRLAAAELLSSARAEDPQWALYERAALKAELEKLVETSLTVNPKLLKLSDLPKPVAQWIVANMKILEAIK